MVILDELINQLLSVKKLPTLSPVAVMLEQSLSQEEPDLQRVSRIISDDPSVTSMVLKSANSVIYGARRTFSTVQEAIVRLGFKEIRKMIFDLSIVKFLIDKTDGLLDPLSFWEHSIGVAHCMEIINEMTLVLTKDGHKIHVVGLLHDIGRWVLANYMPENYQRITHDVAVKKDIIVLERKRIGLDHAQIGAALLERWGLPMRIVHCVRYHHQPEFSPDEESKITYLMYLADNICRNAKIGNVGEGLFYGFKESSWEHLGLFSEKQEHIVEQVRERIKESALFLSIGGLEQVQRNSAKLKQKKETRDQTT
ncbi:MAG TPA: HDOD domain-containing protein [archaeon]|nr:HDOD domain-containing protein [archaeon]